MKRHIKLKYINIKGFTLLEVFIAIVITGMILGGVYSVFNSCLVSWNRSTKTAELTFSGKTAIDFITRDIRESKQIIEIGEDKIKLLDQTDNIFAYNVLNKSIYRVSPEGSSLLVENVAVFNLYSTADKRFVRILLKLEKEDIKVSYISGAALRNSPELGA